MMSVQVMENVSGITLVCVRNTGGVFIATKRLSLLVTQLTPIARKSALETENVFPRITVCVQNIFQVIIVKSKQFHVAEVFYQQITRMCAMETGIVSTKMCVIATSGFTTIMGFVGSLSATLCHGITMWCVPTTESVIFSKESVFVLLRFGLGKIAKFQFVMEKLTTIQKFAMNVDHATVQITVSAMKDILGCCARMKK